MSGQQQEETYEDRFISQAGKLFARASFPAIITALLAGIVAGFALQSRVAGLEYRASHAEDDIAELQREVHSYRERVVRLETRYEKQHP